MNDDISKTVQQHSEDRKKVTKKGIEETQKNMRSLQEMKTGQSDGRVRACQLNLKDLIENFIQQKAWKVHAQCKINVFFLSWL